MNNKSIKSWGNLEIVNTSSYKLFTNKTNHLDVGNLNSYGDCCLPLQKVFKIDKNQLVNENVFNYQIKQGSYLYGTPGKSNVTIGGAIASDTHGKDNIWGGSFYRNVKKIYLYIDGEEIETSREKESDLFNATIGGYGLTGSIVNVELFKSDISISSSYKTIVETGSGIDNLLNSFNTQYKEFWVGWIDLLDKKFPWVSKKSISDKKPIKDIKPKKEYEYNINFPFIGNNKLKSLEIINKIYFQTNKMSKVNQYDFYKTLFPLSFTTDTRNLSKERKIVQVQFSIPSTKAHLLESLILKLISNQSPLLCSIKRLSNPVSINNLSFHQEGWTVAVDFPYHDFNIVEIEKFYQELARNNCKIYLAKDSTLDEKNFRLMYPEFLEWKKIVKSVDPKNLYQSSLSKRLGLKEW